MVLLAISPKREFLSEQLPSLCVCGRTFSVDHALTCATGGYTAMRHNEVRDQFASYLKKVAHDIVVEPPLQPLAGERFPLLSTSTEEFARLDVAASGVRGRRFEQSFMEVRVFNQHAPSNAKMSVPSMYKRHEAEKRRRYEARVRDVGHASFVPIVFPVAGGCGKAAAVLMERVGSMLCEKRNEPFSVVMASMRCRISFALLRSAVASLRGHRVVRQKITSRAVSRVSGRGMRTCPMRQLLCSCSCISVQNYSAYR